MGWYAHHLSWQRYYDYVMKLVTREADTSNERIIELSAENAVLKKVMPQPLKPLSQWSPEELEKLKRETEHRPGRLIPKLDVASSSLVARSFDRKRRPAKLLQFVPDSTGGGSISGAAGVWGAVGGAAP